MRSLRVIGPYTGWSGYDRLTRELVRGLVHAGLEVQLTPVPSWSGEMPLLDADFFAALDTPVDAEVVLHFTTPGMSSPEPGKLNVNYTMFEAERIPEAWARCARGFDAVVVPTESSRRAWMAGGVNGAKVHIPSTVPGTSLQGAPPRTAREREETQRRAPACLNRYSRSALG